MLALTILAWLAVPGGFISAGVLDPKLKTFGPYLMIGAGAAVLAALLLTLGLFTVQPNEGRVLMLFGKYVGTVREEGFQWANPFSVTRGSMTSVKEPGSQNVKLVMKNRYRVSLRARNFETSTLKVNDQRGNPIEIGAVVVWKVMDTAQALFEVDDYENYVQIQSETAVRHLATSYPYDHNEGGEKEPTLRDGGDTLCEALKRELQERLSKAGVQVLETRITHLAYAPEIAALMLRRQQAEAVIAARQKIVHGAVSMVEMALKELSEKKVVELDEERKAAMVGNLLVVLCGESEAQPIVNAGTLYH
ncbi:MAG: SPFH domain-containing protein [Planctomycetes bacterium]|nr:SPFH domain-containing protein [Planctomycetota bacterium]